MFNRRPQPPAVMPTTQSGPDFTAAIRDIAGKAKSGDFVAQKPWMNPARRSAASHGQSWRRTLRVIKAVAPRTNNANTTQNPTPTGPWFSTSGSGVPNASSRPTTTNGIR